jgi:hypothetical protein
MAQLRAAIRKLLMAADRAGETELAAAARAVPVRDDEYATAGKPPPRSEPRCRTTTVTRTKLVDQTSGRRTVGPTVWTRPTRLHHTRAGDQTRTPRRDARQPDARPAQLGAPMDDMTGPAIVPTACCSAMDNGRGW